MKGVHEFIGSVVEVREGSGGFTGSSVHFDKSVEQTATSCGELHFPKDELGFGSVGNDTAPTGSDRR